MNIQELYSCFTEADGIAIDTRNITPNSLFFALKGDNFDANEFAQEALDKGARYVIMDNPKLVTDRDKMFLVPNALQALQQLANYHRQQLGLPIIALTGSNGKTTTKELIKAVLSRKYNVKATQGNYNNHIGVPLTLLQFDDETDIGIVEMGANHLNEIALLCTIAQPDYGYITNFGKAHLEGFGGFEGVIKGKSELYDYLEDNHKMAFVNADDPRQDAKTITFSRYTFGSKETEANLEVEIITNTELATIQLGEQRLTSHLTGQYNATNMAAAVAIGQYFGVSLEEANQAIQAYIPTNNRSQWIKQESFTILLDAYNANPSSMELSVANFDQLPSTSPKIYILGDMFELGEASEKEHKNIIQQVEDTTFEKAFFIGKEFSKVKDTTTSTAITFFETLPDFLAAYGDVAQILAHHTVLIKGSRGMALEKIISFLK
ncbi:UDP-N-acetylmuramoyl-tripeptide--D-alanyl-D-alanine ligase [Myroides odoratus]|uniref:UDP-N-acetylmuramoyl-tripeptide--D-alanyl-D-alanine ligase n=1 Tax=Myroides odoratus TaxID=256 RepID=A0A378RNJ9_MYROD|nr:UDP-N-acetylmuramoyl-tripeptide--D-alanyl-D-alanine ligase [Myroides odoratus]QQU04046.1 UDP-N-acetylmuramoyl-tripeptide--D-alanyl-D-alanine ligase [Myroides odoratus]STZ28565.1 UDP-N-acetylmuramoyl-tripeptide--D-alanyl-D-alanine ligase [Myroides odoratus]